VRVSTCRVYTGVMCACVCSPAMSVSSGLASQTLRVPDIEHAQRSQPTASNAQRSQASVSNADGARDDSAAGTVAADVAGDDDGLPFQTQPMQRDAAVIDDALVDTAPHAPPDTVPQSFIDNDEPDDDDVPMTRELCVRE
jgi:hypothetical protein